MSFGHKLGGATDDHYANLTPQTFAPSLLEIPTPPPLILTPFPHLLNFSRNSDPPPFIATRSVFIQLHNLCRPCAVRLFKYFILRQLRRKWLPILPNQRLMFNRSRAQILAWKSNFIEGKKPAYPEKNPRSRIEIEKSRPTCGLDPGS